jgi:hypothetical protein
MVLHRPVEPAGILGRWESQGSSSPVFKFWEYLDAGRVGQRLNQLFLMAWIVVRIDVVELKRRRAVDLHHDFSAGHRVVMHVGIEISETAGRECSHLAFVKAISHSDLEGSGDDGDVFPLGMPMGRDAISVGHL